jgi:hypothetical protein
VKAAQDFVIADVTSQSVGTQDDDVAVLNRIMDGHISGVAAFMAEGPRQVVAHGVQGRGFGRKHSLTHLLRGPRVVLRELADLIPPRQIRATVANVRNDEYVIEDDSCDGRRTHIGLTVARRLRLYCAVGFVDRISEQTRWR